MNIIDVTNIPNNGKTYNGTTRKYGITINGCNYIVKFAKDNDMSVICEYVASSLIRNMGIPCHIVSLGTYKGQLVNVIKDFTSGLDVTLHSYKDTKQSSEDTDLGSKEYTYDDVLYLIEKHLKMNDRNKQEAKERFWDMFICDAIIGNRDRHWGNWGYLVGKKTNNEYRFAPLYDNGAGLYPGVANVIAEYMNNSTRKTFLYNRVFIVPASLFKIKRPDRTYRSNYADTFKDLRINKVFSQRVIRFRESLSYADIFNIMLNICKDIPVDDIYKRFYVEIVTLRYMCIVLRMDFNKSYEIVEKRLNGV